MKGCLTCKNFNTKFEDKTVGVCTSSLFSTNMDDFKYGGFV